MTEEEAKRIIRDDPKGDIVKRMEAIVTAENVLGKDCTMTDIWRWADDKQGMADEVQ